MLFGDMPGRGVPGRGAPGRACGRGMGRSTGCCDEKGLLPTRGVRGAGLGPPGAGPGRGPGVGPGRVGAGADAAGGAAGAAAAGSTCGAGCGAAGLGVAGRAGVGAGAAGAGAGAAAAGVAGAAGAAGAGAGVRTGGPGRGPGAAAPLPLPALGARSGVDLAPNFSRNRRATGASTVEEADLTNSPCSLSVASRSLLVTPSSFANSCTRALPATTSPSLEATAVVGAAPRVSYDAWSSELHGVLMFFATCSLAG
jgi:hypothetical protein